MNVLLIGSGGREHAIAWKLVQSPLLSKLTVFPGNYGMLELDKTDVITGDVMDFDKIQKIVKEKNIELVIIGPENPLDNGLADLIEKMGVAVVGPSKQAAKLECSKEFSKKLMLEDGIPTANAFTITNLQKANELIENWDVENQGIVIKVDAPAAGKGVVVTNSKEEALKSCYNFLDNPKSPIKDKKIIIEEVVKGEEISAFYLCDGNTYKALGFARDHKRLLDGDKGPNTGGMGVYSTPNLISLEMAQKIETEVVQKTLDAMKKRGIPFKGILFVGLMIDDEKINVLEFNVRLGDPETQALMPLIEGDLLDAFVLTAKGKLSENTGLVLQNKCSVHVVMSSKNYARPDLGKVSTGHSIAINRIDKNNSHIFFAGIKKENNKLLNAGGRVLGVTSISDKLIEARKVTYQQIENIKFEGAHYRKDIGSHA